MKKMPIHATYVVQPLFLLVLLPPTVSSCFEMHHTRNPQNDDFAKPQEDGSMFTFFFSKNILTAHPQQNSGNLELANKRDWTPSRAAIIFAALPHTPRRVSD
jgi:hypothetical protein